MRSTRFLILRACPQGARLEGWANKLILMPQPDDPFEIEKVYAAKKSAGSCQDNFDLTKALALEKSIWPL